MFQKDVVMYHQFAEKNQSTKPPITKKKNKCFKFQYTILTLVLLIILLSISVAVLWIRVQAKFDEVNDELRVLSAIKEDVEYIEQLQYFLNKKVNVQKPEALSQVEPQGIPEENDIPYVTEETGILTEIEEVTTDLQADLADSMYFVTPRPGNWFESKRMCEEQGGSLISDSLKTERGFKSEVLAAIKANNDKHLWVGINRNNVQREWQLLDGSSEQDWVLGWHPGEPNNAMYSGENCAHVITTTSQMNDASCYETFISWNYDRRYTAHYYGLCEKVY